jgi:hypothetical protein
MLVHLQQVPPQEPLASRPGWSSPALLPLPLHHQVINFLHRKKRRYSTILSYPSTLHGGEQSASCPANCIPKERALAPLYRSMSGPQSTTASLDGVVKWEISAPDENLTLILWSLKFFEGYIAHYLKQLFWTLPTITVLKTTTFQKFFMHLSSNKGINSAGSLGRAIPCFESSSSNLKKHQTHQILWSFLNVAPPMFHYRAPQLQDNT